MPADEVARLRQGLRTAPWTNTAEAPKEPIMRANSAPMKNRPWSQAGVMIPRNAPIHDCSTSLLLTRGGLPRVLLRILFRYPCRFKADPSGGKP
jgi:hypothetical protein